MAGYGLDAQGHVIAERGARTGARFQGQTPDGLAVFSGVGID